MCVRDREKERMCVRVSDHVSVSVCENLYVRVCVHACVGKYVWTYARMCM